MEALQSAVTVLTAMITPSVLISSCAALILSTSLRLGRVADRVRALSDKLEEISHGESNPKHYGERRKSKRRALSSPLKPLLPIVMLP